jgi:hypothetical protein
MEGRRNLTDLVGKWLEKEAAHCIWKREIHILEIASRTIFMFDLFLREIRKEFPCRCLLSPNVSVCVYCYIDAVTPAKKVALEKIKSVVKACFLIELKSWPEFLGDLRQVNFAVSPAYITRFM